MTRSPQRLPAAAVFDWDGTIVDTLPLIYRANVVVLGELGIPLSRAWFRERYTPDWRSSYRELGVPEDRWDAVAARWSEEMQAVRPRALPWARGGLRRLARHGVRLGLVTASTRSVVEPNLRRLNLDGLFETAYFSDDVVDGKPHPEGLLRALADLDVVPADAVYVGAPWPGGRLAPSTPCSLRRSARRKTPARWMRRRAPRRSTSARGSGGRAEERTARCPNRAA